MTNSSVKKEAFRLDGFIKNSQDSKTLSCSRVRARMVTSATPPFHVEWVSGEWSKAFGWSSEEIQGLDCKFLQGDVTDRRQVSNFMARLISEGGYAEMEVLNYRKDNVLVKNRIRCTPLTDDCGPHSRTKISHIGVIADMLLVDHHDSSYVEESLELGMPLDRRENCAVYDKCSDLPPPSIQEWATLTENLALALTMRYMLRSQAPIALLDRSDGRIVHVNMSWCQFTGYPAAVSDNLLLRSLFGRGTSASSLSTFDKFIDEFCCSRTSDTDDCSPDTDTNPSTGTSSSRRRMAAKAPPTMEVALVTRLPVFRMLPKEIFVTICPSIIGKHHIAVMFTNASQLPTAGSISINISDDSRSTLSSSAPSPTSPDVDAESVSSGSETIV